ncbi:hypothetical protein LC76P1_00082 [Lysinibacillus phage LC76P1]|nr:hypothetical protein LC76P1_00082 [Lysinibacillus phage LC76P1]
MKWLEVKGNIFDKELVPEYYVKAHCIAQDAAMGAGIAPQFVKRNAGLREAVWSAVPEVGDVVYYKGWNDVVYNMITKKYSHEKPTRLDFNIALANLKRELLRDNVKHLAIPWIGAGLDRLDWGLTVVVMQHMFQDTDITILVVEYDGSDV